MKNLNEFVNEALEGTSKKNYTNESAKYDGDLRDDLEELCNMDFNVIAAGEEEDESYEGPFDDLMDYWDAIFYCAKDDISKYASSCGYNWKRNGLEDDNGEFLVFKKNDDGGYYGDVMIPFILAHYGTEIRPEFEELIDKDWKKVMVKKNFKKIDLTGIK